MAAYYNEIEPFAVEWLKNLIAAGHIADGEVDDRSIEDVSPTELSGFTQCHFFAGIGLWSLALRMAGWPDDRPVWTGSCPCQPFSAAGKGAGFDDERHLWPAWHHHIRVVRPPVVFGEQVARKDGLAWLDLVQADLEGLDYACGAIVAPAAGFGAPHIRERQYFAAHDLRPDRAYGLGDAYGARASIGLPASAGRHEGNAEVDDDRSDRLLRPGTRGSGVGGLVKHESNGPTDGPTIGRSGGSLSEAATKVNRARHPSTFGGLHDADGARPHAAGERAEGEAWNEARLRGSECGRGFGGLSDDAGLGRRGGAGLRDYEPTRQRRDELTDGRGAGPSPDASSRIAGDRDAQRGGEHRLQPEDRGADGEGRRGAQLEGPFRIERPGPTNGFWRDADWLHCRDGKWRPVEPGSFPLAHGYPARVGVLRAAGNAIVPQQAAEVIRAFMGHETEA